MFFSNTNTDPYQLAYSAGQRLIKEAEAPVAEYSLAGRLYVSKSGWGLLHVPNALVYGAFDAIHEPGVELPSRDGIVNAHISVFTKEEVDQIGPENLSERGHAFRYNLGKVKNVTPNGQSDKYSKVWFIEVSSPELKELRRSYGLSPLPKGDHEFHITLAYRKKNVLRSTPVSKAAALEACYLLLEGYQG